MDKGLNVFLAIGIDKYEEDWDPLYNAVGDVSKLGKLLSEKYGFTLFNDGYLVDKAADLNALHDWLYSTITFCTEFDSLVIYFAGHGFERPKNTGNWIPFKGTLEPKSWLQHSIVLNYLSEVPAKHIFLVTDCCYSGAFVLNQGRLLFKSSTDSELENLRSRIILTSGGLTKVSDGISGEGSPFGKSFYQVLEENKEPTLRASKLIIDAIRLTKTRTTRIPEYCEINCDSNQNGEMVFKVNLQMSNIGEPEEEKPEFPGPILPEGEIFIKRTFTQAEYQNSVIDMLFDNAEHKITFSEAVSKDKQIVLLGSAGSGKSVEMIKLFDLLKDKSLTQIPIYVKLNKFAGENIFEYIGLDHEHPKLNSFVVILDGMDEIREEFMGSAIKSLNCLAEKHPLVSIVISARTNFYQMPQHGQKGLLESFTVYHINDIKISDIEAHTRQVIPEDADGFLKEAQQHRILDLLIQPFFLKLAYAYYDKNRSLTASRSELIEQSVFHSLGMLDGGNDQKILLQRLEQVAFIMEYIGRNFLTEEELRKISREDRINLNYIKLDIFHYDAEKDQWMFLHNNIQEYLAAKVLSRLPFAQLIDLVSFKNTQGTRLKATWLNTISFLSSLGDDDLFDKLFSWIIENDPEVVIKIEADRITPKQRLAIFMNIFEFYSNKNIWLASNLFSRSELSLFAQSEEILEYLISVLSANPVDRVPMINATQVLMLFDINKFETQKPKLLGALMGIVIKGTLDPEDMHSVISLIANLHLAGGAEAGVIIQKYRLSRNQFLRAALYKFLADQNLMDDHVDILLDGLELEAIRYGLNDRTDDNLMDEIYNLRLAIEKISSVDALLAFVRGINQSRKKRFHLSRDNRELIPKLINNAIKAYHEGNGLFEEVLDLYIKTNEDFDHHVLGDIVVFFTATKTKREALLSLWKNTDHETLEWNNLILAMLDEELVLIFVGLVQHSDLPKKALDEFHLLLFHKRHTHIGLLELLETYAFNLIGVKLEMQKVIDWPQIERDRSQLDFNSLFDIDLLISNINLIFERSNGKVNRDSLNRLLYNNYDAEQENICQSAIDIVRIFTEQQSLATLEKIIYWINTSPRFVRFRMKRAKLRLAQNNKLVVGEGVIGEIRDWCVKIAEDPELLWFFLHKFQLELPIERLFELTAYSNSTVDGAVDQPGSLEMMEKFLGEQQLKEAVVANLSANQLNKQAWVSNIGYCFRKGISEGNVFFTNAIASRKVDEYKDLELLDLWFAVTSDYHILQKLLKSTNSMSIVWKCVKLLKPLKKNHSFLVEQLIAMLDDESLEVRDRQEAANHLIELGDLTGFDFLYSLVMKSKDPNLDFRHGFRNIELIRSIKTLEPLINLLHLSKTENFKTDIFNDLQSKVLGALVSVGQESKENADIVTKALNNFIKKYEGELPHLNFLHYTIARINDGLAFSEKATINDAIGAFDGIK